MKLHGYRPQTAWQRSKPKSLDRGNTIRSMETLKEELDQFVSALQRVMADLDRVIEKLEDADDE